MDEETEALRGSVELPRVRTESRLWPHLLIPHLFCPLGWENHSFCEYLLSVCYMPGLLANCQKEVPSRVPGVEWETNGSRVIHGKKLLKGQPLNSKAEVKKLRDNEGGLQTGE